MMRGRLTVPIPAVLLAMLAAIQVGAEPNASKDWPQFRGHNRDGISRETGILKEWPADGPKEVWRRNLGEGYSAIVVAEGRLYTMYAAENGTTEDGEARFTEFAAAFDAATGEELWRTPFGDRLETQFGNGPRATPTVDGDTVYALDSHGHLASLSTADGSVRWDLDLTERFDAERPFWGHSTSALVEGDTVIVEAGGKEGKSYVGLDRKTGETRWTLGDSANGPGYNSALALDLAGQRQIVYLVRKKLGGMTPAGEELWSYDLPDGEAHAMPVFIPPDRIFASGAEGVGSYLLRIANNGDGMTAEEVWKNAVMKNHFSSSIYHEGHLYGFDNATLKCVDVETGDQKWAKRGLGKGSLVLADGHLFVLSDRGRLLLLEATGDAYTEKGRVQALQGRCWTPPTLAGGRLYLRNHEEVVVYDLKG